MTNEPNIDTLAIQQSDLRSGITVINRNGERIGRRSLISGEFQAGNFGAKEA